MPVSSMASDFETYLIPVDSDGNIITAHQEYCLECHRRRHGVTESPDIYSLKYAKEVNSKVSPSTFMQDSRQHPSPHLQDTTSSTDELSQVFNAIWPVPPESGLPARIGSDFLDAISPRSLIWPITPVDPVVPVTRNPEFPQSPWLSTNRRFSESSVSSSEHSSQHDMFYLKRSSGSSTCSSNLSRRNSDQGVGDLESRRSSLSTTSVIEEEEEPGEIATEYSEVFEGEITSHSSVSVPRSSTPVSPVSSPRHSAGSLSGILSPRSTSSCSSGFSSPRSSIENSIEIYDENDNISDNGKKIKSRKVSFNDEIGMPLTTVRLVEMDEVTSLRDNLAMRLRELVASYEQPVFPQQDMKLVLDFEQPASDFQSFIFKVDTQKVSLENIMTHAEEFLGTIRVLNIGYEKEVTVRYTINRWFSFTDVNTTHVPQEGDTNFHDVFSFRISVETTRPSVKGDIQFAIRYRVNGTEYWDNNCGYNYALQCVAADS